MGRGLVIVTSLFAASVAVAAPPVVNIRPQNATTHCMGTPCTLPTVDGVVAAVEYADGRSFPLQDYVNGGPNGELFMVVSDTPAYTPASCNSGPPGSPDLAAQQTNPCRNQTLFLGLRIPRPLSQGQFLASSGTVTVWLDALRNDTLSNAAGANVPRAEDRMLVVNYSTSGAVTATINQFVGTGAVWTPLSNMFLGWSMQKAVSIPANDPAHVHIEIAVTLRPLLQSTSEPLTSKRLGLGIQHLPTNNAAGPPTALVGGGMFPNNRLTPPQSTVTSSWVTLDFSDPTPIPMSFTTWNVGQLPYVADGGTANADVIAALAATKDTICLQEVWKSGERLDIVDKVNHARKTLGLPAMNAVYEANDETLRLPTESTGLVLLTAHPILNSAIHHFPSDECTGTDCWQEKGVVWARIGLPSGAPVAGSGSPSVGFDGSEFMDVFCTHVNAGSVNGDDGVARNEQFTDANMFMAEIRGGGPVANSHDQLPLGTWPSGLDRPAILLGDMNTPGPHGFTKGMPIMTKYWGDVGAYNTMMANLDLATPTQFDLTNSIFSDARDLNMTVMGPLPAASGSWLGEVCNAQFANAKLVDEIRYDFVLVVPPDDTDALPAYALSASPGPTASVDAHWLGSPSFTCLSDHAETDVSLGLVRVSDKLKFNPMKPHRVEFEVAHLIDLASGGCCADWYTPQILITSPTLGTELTAFPNYNEFEGQEVSPMWSVSSGTNMPDLPAGFQGRVSATFQLWEYDDGSHDDHYDSIPEGGDGTSFDDLDVHLSFFASTGNISRVAGAGANWTVPIETLGNVLMGPTDVYRETIGNNQDTGDNARVTVRFVITEL